MKTKFKKSAALALAGILAVSTLAACGKPKDKDTGTDGKEKYGNTYPLETNGDKLSMWIINSVHNEYKSYQEMPFFREAQKKTGVELDVQGPTGGQYEESFNLMIASGELPDIILYDWADKKVPGGPSKYIKDGYIRDLTDIIDKYAPNLKKILKENPEIDKAVKTDEGQYYVFPYLNLEKPATYAGPVVRKDWLDELGLSMPETIDDWHNMLTQFKDKKGSTSPLLYIDWLFESTGFLSGAYGTQMGYYLNEDGKLEYGPSTQKWKQFLEMMRSWYAEDLIDKDIATLDATTKQSKIVSGKNGAFLGSGGDMGTYIPLIEKIDPKAEFVGVQYPVLNKGETPEFGICDLKYTGLMSSAITADCKNPELAAKFLDYFYTDEGRLFANFGIEGVTYNMVDGYPKLTDMVIDSGNIQNEISKYANSEFSVVDPRYYEQRMIYPEQNEAIKLWAETNAEAHKLPLILPTAEEANDISKYTTEIEDYVNEMYIKFMIGTESLDKYDEYLAQLDKLGLQKVLKIYNTALERYNKR